MAGIKLQSEEEVSWDLEDLVGGKGAAGVEELLDEADRIAGSLTKQRGKIASLTSVELADVMREMAKLHEVSHLAGSYAGLDFSIDMTDSTRGALMQKVEERLTAVGTKLVFFELEWAALEDEHVRKLLADDALEFCRHHLASARRYRDHLLTEPEEKIMTEKSVTANSAWDRLFGELISAVSVEIEGHQVALERALSRLASPDREVRRATAEAVTEALGPGLKTRTFIYNTLLYDKSVNDRLRGYENWLSSRNLSNEASDESVQALIESVRKRYDIPQRWYALKARVFGLDRLADYDRMASLAADDVTIEWHDAREFVLDSYRSFSPELGELVLRFFEESWIDAPVRPGKRPGAFCSYTVPSVHPYVFLNYTARRRDVLTLAHELGHGVHGALAAKQGIFHQSTPLTVAETASVFGEEVVFGRLLELEEDPGSRLALLAEKIEGAIATVFRQTAMNRFEDLAHTERRSRGELPPERFGELWTQSQQEVLGDAVEITEGYKTWWSYVPHFINTPGYVYAYAYGQLLALSVFKRWQDQGADFVPRYLEMLGAGGSMAPEELGRIVDCDLADPGFWDGGLEIVEGQLRAAEEAAKEAGKL